MYENVLRETTGVKVFQEEERILNVNEYEQLCEEMDTITMIAEDKMKKSQSQVCEVYFDSPIITKDTQQEKFLITIEKSGNNKVFTLKRRTQLGKFGSEKETRISKRQYCSILRGSIDWMKESSKLLVNEFYHKMKLFEYQVSAVITCVREELFLKEEKMTVIVDKCIHKLFGENTLPQIGGSENSLAYVRVRRTNENLPATHIL